MNLNSYVGEFLDGKVAFENFKKKLDKKNIEFLDHNQPIFTGAYSIETQEVLPEQVTGFFNQLSYRCSTDGPYASSLTAVYQRARKLGARIVQFASQETREKDMRPFFKVNFYIPNK